MKPIYGGFAAVVVLCAFLAAPCRALDGQDEGLTIEESMALAVKNNLSVKLAAAESEGAKAQAVDAAARLLPGIVASVSQTRTFRENMDAMGFSGYGFLQPFNTFDARISLVQEVFNWTSLENANYGKSLSVSAGLRGELAREQVAAAAALSYVEVLRADAALEAARADERLAGELLTLAQERHAAGTATGLDVAREKTRAAQEHSRVLRAEVSCDDAGLRLRHVAGLPLDEDLRLSDALSVSATSFAEVPDAIAAARSGRLELAIGREQVRAADYAVGAARGGHLPSLEVAGSLALSGNIPDSDAGSVGDMGVRLKLPLFMGGSIGAGVDMALSRRRAAQARLDDISVQVEQDVRLSLKKLRASVEQAATAEQALSLAASELSMAQGRFAAGVGDNVELVNAQTSLSEARAARVAALAEYNNSKINLALAQGRMRSFSLH